MVFQRVRISDRILAGFSVIMACAIILGIVAIISTRSISSFVKKIFHHPFTVTTAAMTIKSELTFVQKELLEMMQITDPVKTELIVQEIRSRVPEIDSKFPLLKERYLGDVKDVNDIIRAMEEWKKSSNEIIALINAGKRAEALIVYQENCKIKGDIILIEIQDVIDFAYNRAKKFEAQALEHSNNTLKLVIITLLGMISFGFVIIFLVGKSVGDSLRMALSQIQRLVHDNESKQKLVESIGRGDFTKEFNISPPIIMANNDFPNDDLGLFILGLSDLSAVQHKFDKAFKQMAEYLKISTHEEQARAWLKNTLNELNDILRNDLNPKLMSDSLLNFFAKVLDVSVGTIYLFESEERALHLLSSYAHARRKGLQEMVHLGEGLLGQAALGGKMICLLEGPDQ